MKKKHTDSVNWSLAAIELMNRMEIPPEPRNYELFYIYKSGANEALNMAVEDLLNGGTKLGQLQLSRLYDTYLEAGGKAAEIASLGDQLGDQIGEAIELVKKSAKSTSSFGCALDEAGSQLTDLSDPKGLAVLLNRLVRATETMGQSNQELSKRFDASSERIEMLQADLMQVRHESQTDALTGIGNRRYFDGALEMEISRARRQGTPLCLCMLDLDHFKKLNDTRGHVTGDAALRLVAGLMKQKVRDIDVVARFGGEEFVIILPGTSLDDACAVAERIRKSLAEKQLVKRQTGENMGAITASFGIAKLDDDDSADSLIDRADRCLYAAKKAGRNRIETDAGEPTRMALPSMRAGPEILPRPDRS